MKILIVPTIREIYKNQIEYCVDRKLIDFLKVYSKIHILSFTIIHFKKIMI